VRGRRAVPLVLLAAAVVCALVGLRVLPEVRLPTVAGQRTAVIANDTAAAVVVSRCEATCGAGAERVTLAPGQDLRAGPPAGSSWLVQDPGGRRIGCLAGTAGARLAVSRAGPCPA
jgi:hypothetical protein